LGGFARGDGDSRRSYPELESDDRRLAGRIGIAVGNGYGNCLRSRNLQVSAKSPLFNGLLAARDAGNEVEAITLGNTGWIDADLASAFARKSGISHTLISPPHKQSLNNLIKTIGEIEHISDYLSPLWLDGFRQFLRASSETILNGFLGGPLSGGLMSPNTILRNDQKECEISKYLETVNRCAVRWKTLRSVSLVDVDRHRRQVRSYVMDLSRSSSSISFLEMRYRQFGFVVLNTLNLYRNYCTCLTPFSDTRVVRFFELLQSDQLVDQHLYRQTILAHDTTRVPFASTTSQLYRPTTFTTGPLDHLFTLFQTIKKDIVDFIMGHRTDLDDHLSTDNLCAAILTASRDGTGTTISFTEALLLFNAAVWLTLDARS
jgi:hypothetical protein